MLTQSIRAERLGGWFLYLSYYVQRTKSVDQTGGTVLAYATIEKQEICGTIPGKKSILSVKIP
ncbi:MAG: hypothetical protein P8Y37_12265 [Anaerolineales bacterium]